MRILLGKYDGHDQGDFYDYGRGIIRIKNEAGVMWLPLIYTGTTISSFDIERDLVVALLFSDGPINYNSEHPIVENGIAMIVRVPPELLGYSLNEDTDEANLPTKLLGGSASSSDSRTSTGSKDYKVVSTDEMIMMKGVGGQIVIGKDGIMSKGKEISTNFFNSSKAGVLSENWLSSILPPTVQVAIELGSGGGQLMSKYLPDMSILKKIEGVVEAYSGVI
jgi:hypothetical protein